MDYPKQHKEIVEDLLSGKFLLSKSFNYDILKQNQDFYIRFFKESFGYHLNITSGMACLIGQETHETLSRDICIFTGVLCYEMDKDGKNFMQMIEYGEFEYEMIDRYFDNTSYSDLIRLNKQLKDSESRKLFYRGLVQRNIIEKTGEHKFMFTQAIQVFIDFALDFAQGRLNEAAVTTDAGLDENTDETQSE